MWWCGRVLRCRAWAAALTCRATNADRPWRPKVRLISKLSRAQANSSPLRAGQSFPVCAVRYEPVPRALAPGLASVLEGQLACR